MFMDCKLCVAYDKPSVPSATYFVTRNLLVEKDEQGVRVCWRESHGSIAVMLCGNNRSSSKSLDLCVPQATVTEDSSGELIF